MKIIAWNLNHRTLEKPIPAGALRFFERYPADVIVLNEYVDGGSRTVFKEHLSKVGYASQLQSNKLANNNQIFIGSRRSICLGDLAAPTLNEAATSNFLHVKLQGTDVEIVALRAPAYKLSSERSAYWKQMAHIMRSASSRRIVFLGDVNHDPFIGATATAPMISFLLAGGFSIANPKGDWSFISLDGKKRTRIDHAIVSSRLIASDAEYLTSYGDMVLAGSNGSGAISDHAVLALAVTL